MSSLQSLKKILSAPSRVASTLDWKKATGASVLSMGIHGDRIGLAIAPHPSIVNRQATTIETIQMRKRGRKAHLKCKERISQLVNDHKVCGILCSFPLQQDTRRIGAACGRTIHTLECLLLDANIVTPNCPLCLWDSVHSSNQAEAEKEDEWRRS